MRLSVAVCEVVCPSVVSKRMLAKKTLLLIQICIHIDTPNWIADVQILSYETGPIPCSDVVIYLSRSII